MLGGGIALFFILRKKPEPYYEEPTPVASPDTSGTDFGSDIDFGSDTDIFRDPNGIISDGTGGMVTMPVEDRCHVSAIAIMHPEIAIDFYLTRNIETTFGRTEKADIILNKDDKKLSGCHGCFFWNGEMLLVQDRKSTNGTAVNGEVCPKDVWLRLENGAILTAGKYEYRINFTTNH